MNYFIIMLIIDPTFRYRKKPSVPGLLHVRSCGHYYIDVPHWQDRIQKKDFLELFWFIQGQANIKLGGEEMILKGGNVFFLLPGDIHNISAEKLPLEYCWLTFDGEKLNEVIDGFGIQNNIISAGPCPIELFERLDISMRDYTTRGEYIADAYGYHILTSVFSGTDPERTVLERFKKIVSENIADPSLALDYIASSLGIHHTTIGRHIRELTGMSPLEYITALRLQEAISLIRQSDYSIKEIAAETGFANANYFAKVFRKKFGCSPTAFRDENKIF